jgi:hypothetical protein
LYKGDNKTYAIHEIEGFEPIHDIKLVKHRNENMKRLLFVLLACATLTSCFPYHYIASPHTYGRVVDKDTGEPILGARAYFKEHPSFPALTNSDGTFDMPQRKEWILVPLGPFDAAPPRVTLVIEADGYQTVEIGNLRAWEISKEKIELTKK